MASPLALQLPDFPIIPEEDLLKATPDEVAAYNEQARVHAARLSPLDYAQYVSSEAERYKHVELLNDLIVALTEHSLYHDGPGERGVKSEIDGSDDEGMWFHPTRTFTAEEVLKDPDHRKLGARVPVVEKLFVTMPPRHGKSYLVSDHTPAWFLTRFPDARIILCSYEADFAASWGRKVKEHIEEHPEFGIKLNPNSSAASKFNLHHKLGGMDTAGAGGPITGKGAHMLLIDDPIKNAEEALSGTHRENTYNWYISTARSRLEPDAVEMLVHTRWHEDDLGGRLMKKEGHLWYHIDLPALADPTEDRPDALGRKAGEALCPARYTRARLLQIKESGDGDGLGGNYWFSALYQQRPSMEGAGIFKRPEFRYWVPQLGRANPYETEEADLTTVYVIQDDAGNEQYIRKDQCIHFMTVDLAATLKTYSDWTVFSLFAVTQQHQLLLINRLRDRMESADHMDRLKKYLAATRLHTKVSFIGIENATYGVTLIQHAIREGLPVRKLTADKDKVLRALPAGNAVDNNVVYFPKRAPWLTEWEEELLQFPNSAHDDQVDTLAYAVQLLNSGTLALKKVSEEDLDQSVEAKIRRHLEKKTRKTRRGTLHPELGRLRA